jgi:hypothetical protein
MSEFGDLTIKANRDRFVEVDKSRRKARDAMLYEMKRRYMPQEPRRVRRSAFRLGIRLLMAAVNPWSGLNNRESSPWDDQYPGWLPIDVFHGIPLSVDDLAAIKKASRENLRLELCEPRFGLRVHDAAKRKVLA